VRRAGAVLISSVLALSVAGCAGLGLTEQQSGRLKEAQDIADRTTKLYGMPGVTVFVNEGLSPNASAGYAPSHRWILLRRSTLEDSSFIPVLAHELGHVTLGHSQTVDRGVDGRPLKTMADYRRALQQRELDANARGVEIMVRVMKKTEPDAVMAVASFLVGANASREGRAVGLPQAHMHPCDQLMDLVIRFPGDWTREVKCEKAPSGPPALPYTGTDRDLGLRVLPTAQRQP
jgi:hypothetical protein